MSVQTPQGPIPENRLLEIFEETGFEPPAGMPLQDAFESFLQLLLYRQNQQRVLKSTSPRGRTAIQCTRNEATSILTEFGGTIIPIKPVGAEVKGLDTTKSLHPRLAGALEVIMADHGLLVFRSQGLPQTEMGIKGVYLTGDQQCNLSLAFGPGALHSTHGNHEECPNRDIFRLSNETEHGFNEVGPEWHNDGSFERNVFSYVVYHIIKAPVGPGNTSFAHLGLAFEALTPELQERYRKCASVNSNSGVVHPLVFNHHVSGRESLYLHTGMTGSIIERVANPQACQALSGITAWNSAEMDELFSDFSRLLDREDISYNHKWQEGDVIVIDNLAVAHKAMPGAHQASSGLRILHRTTCQGMLPLDPSPALNFPVRLDTSGPCPFTDPAAVWVEGYVGFRWGDWKSRSKPH